ncbi:MAG: D-alanyl-D-alanine carboxypeptidase/D-alanyl-D-alanine-endopeptidase, partial [Bacteroidota bacterium]|nr:D-alanyl-D-alanine carboxypeptidase/D-alanyl-D-alanine-endopeptidase [Bacteroidota bacterium]
MRRNSILLILSFVFFNSFAQKSNLNKEIENLKKDPDLKHASWSVCVMNSSKDSVIAEYNSHLSLVPASTLKIVTTASALSILGSNFTFETLLQHDGIFDSISGVLKGNLYIKGGGDPSLGSEYFKNKKDSLSTVEKWAIILKKKGIRKIEGAVIADASIFEDNMVPSQWIWGDIGNYFGAGACGLSYSDNKYIVNFRSGAAGSKTSVNSIQPAVEGLEFINNVTAGGSEDNAFIFGSQYSYYRMAQGTIPPNKSNYEVEGAMPDPALFCARALEYALKNMDVEIMEKAGTIKILKEK